MTSRWLIDATAHSESSIEWRNLSLGVVNADREIPEQYRSAVEAAKRAHRVIAALRADGRNDLIGEYYTEWGRRVHHDGVKPSPELAAEIAEAVGAGDWAKAADDERWDAEVEASTQEGQDLAGGSDVGSPVIAFGEPRVAVFGPIVSPPPTGAEAVALLDHVVAATTMPGFYELKRGRTSGPELGPRP